MYLVVPVLALLLASQQQATVFVSAIPMPVAVDNTSLVGTVIALYQSIDSAAYDADTYNMHAAALVGEVETYTYGGCTGGHLVTIDDAEKNTIVGNLCLGQKPGHDSWCVLGYMYSVVTRKWEWVGRTTSSSYESWVTGDPTRYPQVHSCSTMNEWLWRTTMCSRNVTPYVEFFVMEYNNCTPSTIPGNGNTMDDDWFVAFNNTVATFDDTNTTEPELVVSYTGSAPDGASKYYKQKVLLAPACVSTTADFAIVPAETGILPDEDYDTDTGILTTKVDIDAGAIEDSVNFWTRINATKGTIDFCLRVDLYNEQNYSMAVETTRITLTVDMTTGFEVTGVNFTNELQTESQEDVKVDYPVTAFFCDNSNEEITPAPTLFPGDILQICVKTDSSDAVVTDVRSVAFKNGLVAGLTLEVINEEGEETNGQTLKTCDETAGVCNIKCVTFSTLYQYDTNNDGVLEDVSAGATMDGTAVLEFGAASGRRGRRHLARLQHSTNRRLVTVSGFDIDLAGNLEHGLPEEDTSSPKKMAATRVVGGLVGVGVAIAASATLVALMLYHRWGREMTQAGGGGETPSAEPVAMANGMAMF